MNIKVIIPVVAVGMFAVACAAQNGARTEAMQGPTQLQDNLSTHGGR